MTLKMLHFDDKTLISNYRLPCNRYWNQHYRDQQKRHGALPVVVQVTNALCFFAKGDFQSEVAFVYLISVGCLVTDLRVDC